MLNFGRVLRKYSEYAKIAENLPKPRNRPKPGSTCTNPGSKSVQNLKKMTSGRTRFRKGGKGPKSDEGRYSPFYFPSQNYFIGFNIGCLFWTLFQTPRFGPLAAILSRTSRWSDFFMPNQLFRKTLPKPTFP